MTMIRETLEFYANKETYISQLETEGCGCCTNFLPRPIDDDEGEKARSCLASMDAVGVEELKRETVKWAINLLDIAHNEYGTLADSEVAERWIKNTIDHIHSRGHLGGLDALLTAMKKDDVQVEIEREEQDCFNPVSGHSTRPSGRMTVILMGVHPDHAAAIRKAME